MSENPGLGARMPPELKDGFPDGRDVGRVHGDGAEIGQQPGHVCLDGGQAHVQLGGDAGVGASLGDGGCYRVLAGGAALLRRRDITT